MSHESKKCSKCEVVKPLNEFGKDRERKFGKSHCNDCRREYRKQTLPKEIIRGAQHRARKFNLECTIKETDITIPEICPYLGIPIFMGSGSCGPNSPSIDRIDPSKGYTKDNILVCSFRANAIKSNATPQELIKIALNLKNILEK